MTLGSMQELTKQTGDNIMPSSVPDAMQRAPEGNLMQQWPLVIKPDSTVNSERIPAIWVYKCVAFLDQEIPDITVYLW